jgi:TonB family protein
MKLVPTTTVTFFLFCFLFVCDLAAQVPTTQPMRELTYEAELVSAPDAKIPDVSKEAFIGGEVNVRVLVNRNGTVKSAAIEYGPGRICTTYSSPPITALRNAALEAARMAKFKPAKRELEAQLTYEFPKPEASNRPVSIAAGPVGEGGGPGLLNAHAISLPKPEYPAAAAAIRATGTVDVNVVVMEDGSVYSAKAARGHPLLQRAAEVAACSAKFDTMINGSPTKIVGILRVNVAP